MEKILQVNLYPRNYLSYEVITKDEYGYPTLIRFYSGENKTGDIMFEWVQTNSTTGIKNLKPVKSKDVLTPPSVAITDEPFTTGTALDLAISLAHKNLNTGVAPVVTSSDGATTFTAGTDYTIDYVNGTITVLSTGTMVVSTNYLIDYTYITSASGDRYWIDGIGSTEWVGKDYQIAEWDGTAWVYTAATTGNTAFVTDLGITFTFDGTSILVFKEGVILAWSVQNININV